jgi:hypothetical protein
MAGEAAVLIARRPGGPVAVRIERTANPEWAADPVAAAQLIAAGTGRPR